MHDTCSDRALISINERIDLNDQDVVEELVDRIRRAAAGARLITLDFSNSDNLTSAVISLTFLAAKVAREYDVPISIIASIHHHRSLVTAGMADYVDLQLCG